MSNFFHYLTGMVMLCMPIILLMLFITKVSAMSCIAMTDKAYILLGTLAIVTYWAIEYTKRYDAK